MINKENSISCYIKKHKSSSMTKYVFKCLECENLIHVQSSKLKEHSGKCKICVRKSIPYKHIYTKLLKSLVSNIEFLSFEEFLELIKNNNCHYCNKLLIYNEKSRNEKGVSISRAYQLDRKDNLLGYIKNNLVPCCWKCNQTKSNRFTYEEFMKLSPILKEIEIDTNKNEINSFHK